MILSLKNNHFDEKNAENSRLMMRCGVFAYGHKNGAEKDFENSAPNPYYYPKKTFT